MTAHLPGRVVVIARTTRDGYDWPLGHHDEQCWPAAVLASPEAQKALADMQEFGEEFLAAIRNREQMQPEDFRAIEREAAAFCREQLGARIECGACNNTGSVREYGTFRLLPCRACR